MKQSKNVKFNKNPIFIYILILLIISFCHEPQAPFLQAQCPTRRSSCPSQSSIGPFLALLRFQAGRKLCKADRSCPSQL